MVRGLRRGLRPRADPAWPERTAVPQDAGSFATGMYHTFTISILEEGGMGTVGRRINMLVLTVATASHSYL